MKAKRGFTLVEILIVVVILGILAAIVVPQFTEASTEAQEGSLASNLQSMRAQIELYKAQHNDTVPLPEYVALGGVETWTQMTQTSDINGAVSGDKVRTPVFNLGPYLERIPNNPFTRNNNMVAVANRLAVNVAPPVAPAVFEGWAFVEATGEIYANDGGVTAEGILHADF